MRIFQSIKPVSRYKRRYAAVLLGGFFILFRTPAWCVDVPSAKIQDDSSLRISLMQSWFTEAPAKALASRPFIYTLPGGGRIQVRAEDGGREVGIVLARELNGAFPGWAQGSWILTRAKENGVAVKIRVFLRSDPYTYVQFQPMGNDKSQIDVVLYDAYIVRSLPVPVPFDRLLVLPVEDALSLAGKSFPRRYFDPYPEDYRDVRTLIAAIRDRLPGLSFQDDGALDDRGRYVYIETLEEQTGDRGLNCSGFAKWVVDGILRPITGSSLPIAPLKAAFGERGSPFTGPYEASRAPFFGLDWTRNLASRANSVLRSPGYGVLEEIEVRNAPFNSIIRREREGGVLRSFPGFLLNAGFSFEGVHPLLYTLAIDEPGRIYLASINNEVNPAPRMRQHFHVAVLVPYFNENGNFQVALFESAEETSFSQFKNRYPGHCVNLVRIPVEGNFDPES
ncbi:MAG: hypothetical protein LBH70_01190 [Spirochaetaceae bacterium]|jgi:hypothetical protein|nr:hypothetical protein [Spirochaetaceae bacterium]